MPAARQAPRRPAGRPTGRSRQPATGDGSSNARSPPGGRVLQPPVLVELVPPARQPERLGAEVGVVVLAVIADRLDDLVAPVVGDAHVASEFALEAEKRARLRVGG